MLNSKILDKAFQAAINSIIITECTKPDNPIVYMNPAFEKLTGYSAEDVIGSNCRFLQGEDTDPKSVDKIRTAIQAGTSCEVTLLNYRKDKTPFWNKLYVAPLKNTNGVVTHFIGIQHDVTEQVSIEKNIHKQFSFTQSALDALKGHIAVLDQDGNIVAVNASWRSFADSNCFDTPSYGIGANYLTICDQTVGPERAEAQSVAQGIRDVIAQRCQEFSLEYPCHSPDGLEKRWFMLRVTSFGFEGDVRVVVSHTNITDRKRAEIALQTAYDEMEARVKVRTKELQIANAKLLGEIDERLRIEEALRESEARLRAQYRGIPIPTYTWQKNKDDFELIDYNDSAGKASHAFIPTQIGIVAKEVYGEGRVDILDDMAHCFSQQSTIRREIEHTVQGTRERHFLHVTYGYVPPNLVIVHVEDVTEQKTLESRLLQAEKMEAVGLLAGGVAHDFNNLLTVINGYSKIALGRLSAEQPEYGMIDEIYKAGNRATLLTKQLLAFSRKQVYRPHVVNLNDSVVNLEKMLSRLIPANIKLEIKLDDDLKMVNTDVGHFEQVLMNLVVNAKDAMSSGGQLTITSRNVQFEESQIKGFGTEPGDYVEISVCDTGVGIDSETERHIFDPFFTTKGLGKGTGLGLSTVHGIMQQSGGWVDFETTVGEGTTFSVYYPCSDQAPTLQENEREIVIGKTGQQEGTILLVEDDVNVSLFMRRTLQNMGYTILMASNAKEALQVFESNQAQVDVLVTDVILPDQNGVALVQDIQKTNADIQVLFVSGYSSDELDKFGIEYQSLELLPKPFTADDLKSKVYDLFNV